MNLPADVHRCRGMSDESDEGNVTRLGCVTCERRLAAVSDYMAGAKVLWMHPRDEVPCQEKLEARK